MSRAATSSLQRRITWLAESRIPVTVWVLAVLAATATLVCAMVPVGPDWLGTVGAVAIGSTYAWALAARTGGRPVLAGMLCLGFGLVAVLTNEDVLRTGAAAMTAALAGVLGVLATVPARGFFRAVGEVVVAVVVAGVGALAAVGFEPALRVTRFEYVVLGLALAGTFGLVYRLGAGLHGLGRRGLLVVGVGSVLLVLMLLYGETLHRYGSSDLIDTLDSWVAWCRDELGAFPRPVMAVVGVPALVYGVHLRARRRQGWWVCMFGAAATARVASSLADPTIELREILLGTGYALLVGVALGWILVRIDLALSGNRGARRRADELASAVRPEPRRTAALL